MSFLKGVSDEIEVHVTVVIEGNLGKVVKVPFKAKFRRLTVLESRELFDRVKDGELSDEDVMRDNLLGWRDLLDSSGEQYEFSAEHLAEVMQWREYRKALVEAFTGTVFGREAIRAKN